MTYMGFVLAIGGSLNGIKERTGLAVDLPDIATPLAHVAGQVMDTLLGAISGRVPTSQVLTLAREIVVQVGLAVPRTCSRIIVAPDVENSTDRRNERRIPTVPRKEAPPPTQWAYKYGQLMRDPRGWVLAASLLAIALRSTISHLR